MSLRPPKALAPKDALKADPLSAALDHEVMAEKAATYGRLVEKLQKALRALQAEPGDVTLEAASRALWYVMIQRDLCGFRRHDLFYKELNVPKTVRNRMGMARSR